MRRLVWGIIVLAWASGLAASASAALGTGTRVRVRPGRGGIHTTFVLRFSIPDATGATGDASVSDSVSVTGRGGRGCVGEAEIPLRSAAAGTAFRLALNPTDLDGHWCTGTFNGELVQRRTTACSPGPRQIVCPLYVVAPRVLGRFRFTVAPPEKDAHGRLVVGTRGTRRLGSSHGLRASRRHDAQP